MQHAFPVVEILLAERSVEAVGVARGGDVGGRRAFAQHLLDGISGDEVDEQEDEADHQPDDWQGVEDALEEEFQLSVLSYRLLSFSVGARVERTPRRLRMTGSNAILRLRTAGLASAIHLLRSG